MNRTDRLVAMVMHLQGRRVVRAEELAEHFSISLRTVYRDIAALGEGGVPIVGEAGVGYTLVKGYHLPPVMLTAEEAGALFTGGELAKKLTDGSLDAAVDSALSKLRAVLPSDRKDHLEHLARGTVISGIPRVAETGREGPPCLAVIQQAVARRRVLALVYRRRNQEDETLREVEPMGVVFYGGQWYLVAWCRLRDDLRHFRVDRIQGAELRTEAVTPREGFSLSRHIEAYAMKGDTYPATVWFSKSAQDRAARESYATLAAQRDRDGGTEFAMLTWSYDWLARWIMSFGGEAMAVEPAVLREKVATLARAVSDAHQEASAGLLT